MDRYICQDGYVMRPEYHREKGTGDWVKYTDVEDAIRTHDALRELCRQRGTPLKEQSPCGEDIVLWAEAKLNAEHEANVLIAGADLASQERAEKAEALAKTLEDEVIASIKSMPSYVMVRPDAGPVDVAQSLAETIAIASDAVAQGNKRLEKICDLECQIKMLHKRVAELIAAHDAKCDDCVRHQDNVSLWEQAEKAEAMLRRLATEINCRIEHAADSNGHLEGLQKIVRGEA